MWPRFLNIVLKQAQFSLVYSLNGYKGYVVNVILPKTVWLSTWHNEAYSYSNLRFCTNRVAPGIRIEIVKRMFWIWNLLALRTGTSLDKWVTCRVFPSSVLGEGRLMCVVERALITVSWIHFPVLSSYLPRSFIFQFFIHLCIN